MRLAGCAAPRSPACAAAASGAPGQCWLNRMLLARPYFHCCHGWLMPPQATLCVAGLSICSRASHGAALGVDTVSGCRHLHTHTHIHLCYRYVNLQQGLAEDVARWFFQQIVLALDYMHRYNTTLSGLPVVCHT